MEKHVLVLLAPGFEEMETVAPVDLLRRAGARVVVAAVFGGEWVTGRSGLCLRADAELGTLDPDGFDALVIPGGPGVQGLREDGRAAELARRFARAGKLVAAICAGPTVLADAGLLDGRRYTAHSSTCAELPDSLAGERAVCDGNIVTSRGAGTAADFGLAVVEWIFGAEKAREIAVSIMA